MKRWHYPVAAVALLAAAAGGVYLLREDLANMWIKRQLAGRLARALEAEVDLQGVEWRDGILQARRFRIAGEKLPFARLEARGIRAMVDWQRILEPTQEPLHIEVTEADVVWKTETADSGHKTAESEEAAGAAALPLDLLVGRLSFRRNEDRGWSVDDSEVRALRRDGAWSLAGKGGTLAMDGRAPLTIQRFSAEGRNGRWNIGSFALQDTRNGVIAGSAAGGIDSLSGEFSWQDVDLGTLLTPPASDHVEGTCSGDAVLKDGVLRGQMKIPGVKTKTVGLFVKLASLLDGEDLSTVPWKIFRFDFVRAADGRVDFTDLQALSPQGIAVRGGGYYAADSLGADLQVGVRREGRPYLAAFVPVLFSHERDGYFWTQVKVGGTPASPTENLTARIATALALAPAAGAAESALEIPGAATEAVGDMLRGLLRH